MFDAAFPEIPVSERYTLVTGSFAIAAYQRSVLTNQAPFQRFVKGDNYKRLIGIMNSMKGSVQHMIDYAHEHRSRHQCR